MCRNLNLTLIFLIFSLITQLAANISAAPGDLDFSFGTSGRVRTVFPVNSATFLPRANVNALVVQADGKIVGAGQALTNTSQGERFIFALVRYNPNGSLDTTFDGDGRVTTEFGFDSGAQAVTLQPDGKIVAAGFANMVFGGTNNYAFALARYNADGSLDTSFGTGGKVTTDITANNDQIMGVAVQPDGRIVVGGFVNAGAGATDFAAARYNANGTLDANFGAGGIARTDFAGTLDGGSNLALQPDGKIIVVGTVFNSSVVGDFALVRYNTDGSLDAGFGTGGKVRTDFGAGETAEDLAIQTDGKIVAVGSTGQPGSFDFAAARYNANGTLDTSFDGDGKAVINFGGGTTSIDNASAVAIQQNGKIVIGGTAPGPGGFDFAVTQLNANGSLDSGFGSGGKTQTDFGILVGNGSGFTNDNLGDLVLQTDGKIVAGGDIETIPNQQHDVGLARFHGDPLSTSGNRRRFDFDGDGRSDISVFRPADGVWYVQRTTGGFSSTQFGLAGDKPVPADFDGDGKTDVAVYREGIWYILQSGNNQVSITQFGLSEDKPQPVDFDGDGRAELAVYRPSDGVWYILSTATNQFQAIRFGLSEDIPVAADFTGDGRAELAVWRPSSGVWYWLDITTNQFHAFHFGQSGDKPVVGDFDGDNRTDFAVYRPSSGIWYEQRTTQGFIAIQFGVSTDIPVPADFDGDNRTDIAVFRPSNGVWYIQQSQSEISYYQFGKSGDVPIAAAFNF